MWLKANNNHTLLTLKNTKPGPWEKFKLERFEKLWEGVTPKGVNRTKALKFRQYMRNHVLQKFHKRSKEQWANADKGHYNHGFSSKDQFLTKDNCRKYWMGELQKDIREAETWS